MSSTYSDYMKDRTGWFFGLTGLQLTLIALAASPIWLALNSGAWAWLVLWVPFWMMIVVLVAVPVRGWSAAQWVGVLAAHGVGAARGWTVWTSRVVSGDIDDLDEADLPGVLAGVQVHDGPPLGPAMTRVAIVQHHATRTWAVTARIEHPGLGLVESDGRDRMGAGLAELCETASRAELINTITLQVRTVPDDGAERESWVRLHRRTDGPHLAAQVNALLATQIMTAAVRTEAFVSVVVSEDKLGRGARRGGGGIAGRAGLLYGVLAEVQAHLLGGVGCTGITWLDSPSLAAAIRTGFEPGDRQALVSADLAHQRNSSIASGLPLSAAGPATARAELRAYRHGDWVSVTDTILLPEQGAVLGALAPVLVPTEAGERRCLTVFLSPIGQAAADRLTRREELSAVTGAELRRRTGSLERAKERRDVGRVRRTDEKLARGRSLVRAAAVVTTTIPSTWSSTDAGRRLDASIRVAGYVPQRLDGCQDAAFALAAVPLGVTPRAVAGAVVRGRIGL